MEVLNAQGKMFPPLPFSRFKSEYGLSCPQEVWGWGSSISWLDYITQQQGITSRESGGHAKVPVPESMNYLTSTQAQQAKGCYVESRNYQLLPAVE